MGYRGSLLYDDNVSTHTVLKTEIKYQLNLKRFLSPEDALAADEKAVVKVVLASSGPPFMAKGAAIDHGDDFVLALD
ncbi:hypothetical protein EVAR_39317_1 [Eumeta japonica]|uniref:Uncharacterized protein n=1 Tax=Eumeta variegata TaxID=151549 RepID=A0A4C1VYD0_EUMVA|nr:hypothetical protein EVAR_39317_1 [Eumeta japonica]